MIRVKRLIKICSITIVTIFLMAFIAAGVILLMLHYDCGTEKLFYCYDFGQDLYAAARYYCWPYPPSDNWIESNKVKYVQRYIRNEKVQKIAFGGISCVDEEILPDNWEMRITENKKIKQVFELISSAQEEKAVYAAFPWDGRMIIVADKHKFIIPVEVRDDAVYGWDWKSKELRKKLWEWDLDRRVYKYDLPSKDQTVAILLFLPENSPLLAFFGNKKLAEQLLFEPPVRDDPNGIIGLAGLYKTALLRKFGFEFKKEEGEWTTTSKELEPKKIFEGRDWLEKIMDAYEIALKEAESKEKYFPMEIDNPAGRIVFMTRNENCWKEIGIDENTVYDDYIKSAQLKAYFDELGLTKELLMPKSD